jgi:RNA polymerase sigma-70 factor (ECF subfamily)
MMAQTKSDDAQLVRRVLAGDERSFAALVERYADALSSIAFLITRSGEDTGDVVQQALFIAYCNLSDLAEPEKFGKWVKRIVLNLSRKAVDKRARARRFLERLPQIAAAPDPADQIASREKAKGILRALDTLDEAHREVVTLHYFQNMKVDVIAHLVGRPAGSVKRMLAEARGKLRKELIEMAREEFGEYLLTKEQRERLAKIAKFPRVEPKISVKRLGEKGSWLRAIGVYGSFVELCPGREACYADYDHPGGKLTMVSHVRAEGQIRVKGKSALRLNSIGFSGEGKVEGGYLPYYLLRGDKYLYCAKQYYCGPQAGNIPLLTPEHPDWKEPKPKPESLVITPGSRKEPDGDWNGFIVDTNLYEVRIGKCLFRCLRRTRGGGKRKVDWSDTPVTVSATEEFFLKDGRLLLWRRYNGLWWSEKHTGVKKKYAKGTYESLAKAGVAMLEIFDEKYYLWYDQIPDYAIR